MDRAGLALVAGAALGAAVSYYIYRKSGDGEKEAEIGVLRHQNDRQEDHHGGEGGQGDGA